MNGKQAPNGALDLGGEELTAGGVGEPGMGAEEASDDSRSPRLQ